MKREDERMEKTEKNESTPRTRTQLQIERVCIMLINHSKQQQKLLSRHSTKEIGQKNRHKQLLDLGVAHTRKSQHKRVEQQKRNSQNIKASDLSLARFLRTCVSVCIGHILIKTNDV